MKVPQRNCDKCNLCCKLLKIESPNERTGLTFSKKENELCIYWEQINYCSIYNDRPKVCKDFACLWLHGLLMMDQKPDKIGVMVFKSVYDSDDFQSIGLNRGELVWIFMEDIVNAALFRLSKFMLALVETGQKVIVVNPEGRKRLFTKSY